MNYVTMYYLIQDQYFENLINSPNKSKPEQKNAVKHPHQTKTNKLKQNKLKQNKQTK